MRVEARSAGRTIDLVPLLADAAAVRKAVLGAVDPAAHRQAADFAALYRRSGTQGRGEPGCRRPDREP